MISLQLYAKIYLWKSIKLLLWNEMKTQFTFLQLLTLRAPSQVMTLSPVFKTLVNSPANLPNNDGSPTLQSSTYKVTSCIFAL